MPPIIHHHAWTTRMRTQAAEQAITSPLLALHFSSDVDPILPEQIAAARAVLREREDLSGPDDPGWTGVLARQREVAQRFLRGRREHFGSDQVRPLPDAEEMAAEGRDVFLIIKFMDEAPHLRATLDSLVTQTDVDLGRVVIVAVDNNSTDGSDDLVREMIAANPSAARICYLNQSTPGAGNAARLGVDRCVATVWRMCELDGDWSRLQHALIAMSDGDTVYHPRLLHESLALFAAHPAVDAVMPFLTYKLTAGLRLFADHQPADPDRLRAGADLARATATSVDLSGELAFDALPRAHRRLADAHTMLVTEAGGAQLRVELTGTDEHGLRYGVLRDPRGRLAYLRSDRQLVLASAPVSGLDAALVDLENGQVRADERWRWHAVIGHDLFLQWLFAGLGLPEQMIYPDTSDALKMFRAWAYAIGGQHQLRRPGLRIVTGSDYQSGRILQEVGATVLLGPATANAQTEIDRLIKMARNLVENQSVFYGGTRATALERASGLYVHMTRIQGDIEAEVRGYPDQVFERTVFPERVLFPLRWILQNALRYYAHEIPGPAELVREQVLPLLFGAELAPEIEREFFAANAVTIRDAGDRDRLDLAERIAGTLIAKHYPALMRTYRRTLADFFTRHGVPASSYEWLLAGLPESRNAIVDEPPEIDPAQVWHGEEFVVDVERGQAVGMHRKAQAR